MLSKNAAYLLQKRYCKPGETPEGVFKRVAESLAQNDRKFEERLYNTMESGIFLPNSPCLFNAGTKDANLHACMTKDTIIHTLKGDFSIEQLLIGDDKFWVYCSDGKKLKISIASKPILTKTNADVYKIEFNTGDSIKLTEDHLVMMRDGSFKRVNELKIDDSLMPFNYVYASRKEYYGPNFKIGSRPPLKRKPLSDKNKKCRRIVYENIDGKPVKAFRFVYEQIYGDLENGKMIHHYDFDIENDEPENLKAMAWKDHYKLHGEFNVMKTPEMKRKFSKLMKGNKIGCGPKPESFKEYMRENSPLLNPKIAKIVSNKLKGRKHSTTHIENWKKSFYETCERYTFVCEYCGHTEIGLTRKPKRFCNRTCHNLFRWNGPLLKEVSNHKIISITYSGKEDVYDIPIVEKYHNFAANTIFIHNCYILGIADDIHAIFNTISNMAFIFKSGGGVGINFSPLRECGARLSGGGLSSGVISFMKIFDHVVDTVKQGGVRRGALMGILDYNHADIVDFIRVKLKGDLQNFNLSIMVNDDFMKMTDSDKKIPLKSPTGNTTENVKAKDIFELACFTAWCNGDPAFLFFDRINKDNPFYPQMAITATNPCSEVALPDYSACCLGSINLSKFLWKNEFNFDRFEEVIKIAMRALTSMNKISTYPLPEIAEAMAKYNPVGLGVMGFADCLIKLSIKYDSKECLDFIDQLGDVYKRVTDEYNKEVFYFYKRIIAPTGSLSILADCSSGIEPVYDTTFERRLTVGVIEETRDLYKSEYVRTAYQVSPEWHIKVLSQWQKWVNGGVSKTVNLPRDASVDDIKNLYKLAWKSGCKGVSIYRDGCRGDSGQVMVSKTNKFSIGGGKCSDDSCTL